MSASIRSFTGLRAEAATVTVRAAKPQPVRAAFVVTAKTDTRKDKRQKKHMRIRSKVVGTAEQPRLAVFRSHKHIYAQVINDDEHQTLAAASTLTPAIREALEDGNGADQAAAAAVGKAIAEACLEKNIEQVCFDRGGFLYHGRIVALADAAREAGLSF